MRALCLVIALAGCAPSRPVSSQPTAPAAVPDRFDEGRALVRRIGIVGASQSAGLGDGIALERVIDAALAVEHECFDVSSSAHFVRPIDVGRAEVVAITLRRPTLVIAVDFLLWFAYGEKPLAQREADLELAFALLEGIGAPVLVGDIPDLAGASQRMLAPEQIPPPDEIAAVNQKIHAWAEAQKTIVVLPIHDFTDRLRTEQPIAMPRKPVQPRTRDVLQSDGVHTTQRGQALLAMFVLDELERSLAPLGPDDRQRDPAAFMRAFGPAREPTPLDELPPPP